MIQDTICAIATAQGGAIGSIRVSGPEAISITGSIFKPAKAGKLLSEQKPYTLTFGRIYDGDEIIDEVLVSLFRAPHSYTGEDSTEITCHGSSYILQQVMQLLIKNGCRMAQPGEYTQRAFLNGKMDLSQAEAVADLIASSSAATHRLAMSQMRGGFSKELTELRNKLLNFTSMIELELDFSEEDVEFADRSALRKLADEIEQQHANLVSGKQPVGALAVWHGHAAAVTVGVGANEKVGAQALTVGKAERHRLADLGVRVGAGREMAVWLCLLGDEREISDTKRSANPFDAFAAGAIERRVDDA